MGIERYFCFMLCLESWLLTGDARHSEFCGNVGCKKSITQMAFSGDYCLIILPCPRRLSLPWRGCGQLTGLKNGIFKSNPASISCLYIRVGRGAGPPLCTEGSAAPSSQVVLCPLKLAAGGDQGPPEGAGRSHSRICWGGCEATPGPGARAGPGSKRQCFPSSLPGCTGPHGATRCRGSRGPGVIPGSRGVMLSAFVWNGF